MKKRIVLVALTLLSINLLGQVNKPSKEFRQIEDIIRPVNLEKKNPEFYMENLKYKITGHQYENGGSGLQTAYVDQISFFVFDSTMNKNYELIIYGREPRNDPFLFIKVSFSVIAKNKITSVAWIEKFWRKYLQTEIPKLELTIN